jgi:hypothetical protein
MKRIFKYLASISFGLVVSILLLEILVRFIKPHPHYVEPIRPDPYTGFLLEPNFRGRYTNMFGEFDTLLETNFEGFRDSNHSIQKPADTIRIAFLGDSFTCAEQVEETETFVRRTERSLNTHSQTRVECMNFGMSGYDTQQELLCYEHFTRKYHPDLVVLVMYPRNDMMGNVFYEWQDNFGRPYFKMQNGEKKLAENYIRSKKSISVRWYQHLQSYNAYKHCRWEIQQIWKQCMKSPSISQNIWKRAWYDTFQYYLKDPTPVAQDADRATRLLLQKLSSEIQADGSHFCIMICPSYSEVWPERWPERVKFFPGLKHFEFELDKPFIKIPEFLATSANHGEILDLRADLRKADSVKTVFFHRDNHYNAWGHETVAQALAPFLSKQLELKR